MRGRPRTLTDRLLLSANGLSVKRSSVVCALVARLLGVELTTSRPITRFLQRYGDSRSTVTPMIV